MFYSSYLGHRLTVPQLPDGAEVVEELPADGVPVEDGRGEEAEEEGGGSKEEEVKAGVRVGEEGRLALRAENKEVKRDFDVDDDVDDDDSDDDEDDKYLR